MNLLKRETEKNFSEWVKNEFLQSRLALLMPNVHKSLYMWLVKSGADVNKRDADGFLGPWIRAFVELGYHFPGSACDNDICEVIETLKENNFAHWNTPNYEGNPVLFHAIRKHVSSKIINLLLSNGVKWDFANSEGETALHISAKHEHCAALELLLKFANSK